jgi:hypothetical protein
LRCLEVQKNPVQSGNVPFKQLNKAWRGPNPRFKAKINISSAFRADTSVPLLQAALMGIRECCGCAGACGCGAGLHGLQFQGFDPLYGVSLPTNEI